MQSCIGALPEWACAFGFPVECSNIFDPAPAMAWCKRFLDTYCSTGAPCDSSKAECLVAISASIDCESAVGVGPGGNECMSAMEQLRCGDADDGFPAACAGVLKVR